MDEQFQQLQMLQDEGGTPGFVSEVVTLFCDDADRIINEIATLLCVPPPPLVLSCLIRFLPRAAVLLPWD